MIGLLCLTDQNKDKQGYQSNKEGHKVEKAIFHKNPNQALNQSPSLFLGQGQRGCERLSNALPFNENIVEGEEKTVAQVGQNQENPCIEGQVEGVGIDDRGDKVGNLKLPHGTDGHTQAQERENQGHIDHEQEACWTKERLERGQAQPEHMPCRHLNLAFFYQGTGQNKGVNIQANQDHHQDQGRQKKAKPLKTQEKG